MLNRECLFHFFTNSNSNSPRSATGSRILIGRISTILVERIRVARSTGQRIKRQILGNPGIVQNQWHIFASAKAVHGDQKRFERIAYVADDGDRL